MNNKAPIVSIGIPVFNGERYLREALDSLLNQTFSDFEIIISDNASTDATEEICREYTIKDSRIRYYRQQNNLGAARNFNYLVKLAHSKYFKWASYDDICAPQYLEECVEILERHPSVVLCYPKANEIDEEGNVIGIYTENLNIHSSNPYKRLYQLLETYGWYHATQAFGLIRTDALKKTLLIGNYAHADRVFLAELAILGEFYEVPQFLFNRRVHPQIAQRANSTDESFSAWFDPKNKSKVLLPRWRRYFEYCRAVQRSHVSWDEKILCYVQIVRRLFLSPGQVTRLKGIAQDALKAARLTLVLLLGLGKQPRKTI